METPPYAHLRGGGIATDFDRRLASTYLASKLLYFRAFDRIAHQCVRSRVSSIGYKVPKMWFPLALGSLSETTQDLVQLADDTNQLPHL